MARVNRIASARPSKRPRTCQVCRTEITPGMPYKWVQQNRYAPRQERCATCPDWRPSETDTTKMATALAGQEDALDALDALAASSYVGGDSAFDDEAFTADVEAALQLAAEAAQTAADEYQEGIDNLPENLQESSPSAEMAQEKIDALEAWRDEVDAWSTSISLEDCADADDYVTGVIEEAREAVDSLEY